MLRDNLSFTELSYDRFRNSGCRRQSTVNTSPGRCCFLTHAVTWLGEQKHPSCKSSSKFPNLWANHCYFRGLIHGMTQQALSSSPHLTPKKIPAAFPVNLLPITPLLSSSSHQVPSFPPPNKPACYKHNVTALHLKESYVKQVKHAAKISPCLWETRGLYFILQFTQLNPQASSCLESHFLCSGTFC